MGKNTKQSGVNTAAEDFIDQINILKTFLW